MNARRLFSVVAFVAALAPSANAATLRFLGTVDSAWNNADNWDLRRLPVADDDVVVSSLDVVVTDVQTVRQAQFLEARVSVEGAGALLSIGRITMNTATIDVTGGATVVATDNVSGGAFNVDGSTFILEGSGNINYNGVNDTFRVRPRSGGVTIVDGNSDVVIFEPAGGFAQLFGDGGVFAGTLQVGVPDGEFPDPQPTRFEYTLGATRVITEGSTGIECERGGEVAESVTLNSSGVRLASVFSADVGPVRISVAAPSDSAHMLEL
jgi:hypothetical protein